MSHLTQPVLLEMIGCTAAILFAVVLLGRKLSVKVGKLHAEFSPNGGSSMRDAVDRLEKGQHVIYGRLDALEHPVRKVDIKHTDDV